MPAGLYEPDSSILHRADPAAKLLTAVSWFAVALLLSRPAGLILLGLVVFVLAVASGLLHIVARFGRFMALLFVMCALLWAAASIPEGGRAALRQLGPGAWLGLRLVIMLTMGLLLLASTKVEEFASALRRLGLPFLACFSLTLAFRLLPLFAASAGTIVEAQACRGLDVRQGRPLARLRGYLPLLVPLVLSSIRAADGLAVALESRGLGMLPRRTSVLQGRMRKGDLAVLTASALAAMGLAALKLSGWDV